MSPRAARVPPLVAAALILCGVSATSRAQPATPDPEASEPPGVAATASGGDIQAHAAGSTDSPSPSSASDDGPHFPVDRDEDDFEWFALPLVGYSSDIGLAGIALGVFVWHEEGHDPYRDRLQIVVSATTEKVVFGELRYERLGLFGAPLRLSLMGRFSATGVSNYCGVGNLVSCSGDDARAAATDAGLVEDTPDYDRFVRRYYRFRVTRPELFADLRYDPWPRGPELSFGWHLAYELSGFFLRRGTFSGSLYDRDYPGGEEGLRSEARLGLVYDRRDDERRPSSGYVVDVALRGAASFVGSAWDYLGVTAGAAAYLSFDARHRYVWANRLVADLVFGSAPTVVLGTVGGLWPELAFGGQYMGRGIRARRYIGRVKLIEQSELRLVLFGRDDGFRGLAFAFGDVGYVGVSTKDFGGDPARLLLGFGLGVGAYWGTSFVLRFDVATSALEGYRPSYYLTLTHPF